MLFKKPTIESAIEHFTKGTETLQVVQENAIQEAAEKTEESERLDLEASQATDTANRAGRIIGRLQELLA